MEILKRRVHVVRLPTQSEAPAMCRMRLARGTTYVACRMYVINAAIIATFNLFEDKTKKTQIPREKEY